MNNNYIKKRIENLIHSENGDHTCNWVEFESSPIPNEYSEIGYECDYCGNVIEYSELLEIAEDAAHNN